MAAPVAGRLRPLLSALQSSSDAKTVLNVVRLLDELLSAGTERRIHYLISEGGSEALLQALVNTASTGSPDYSVLLPLLNLLAKVGHRDRRVGQKAEEVGAVLLTLSLLRRNVDCPRKAVACLRVLRVFCSSQSAAALLGENRCADVLFPLVAPRAAQRAARAAVDAFAGLMRSRANRRRAAANGDVSGLLRLYEDWHRRDGDRARVTICRALLHCLNRVTDTAAASAALLADGGLGLLFRTTQVCLAREGLSPLLDPAVQLMRKCYPKSAVPLASESSACTFPLPARCPAERSAAPAPPDEESEDDSEEDDETEHNGGQRLLRRTMVLIFSGETPSARISEEGARKTPNGGGDGSLPPVPPSLGDRKVVFTTSSSCGASPDGDLETEPNKLRARPEPDRPQDQLGRYAALCPELRHHFQDLDSSEESSVGVVCSAAVEEGGRLISASRPHGERGPLTPAAPPESHTPHGGAEKLCIPEEPLKTTDFHCSSLRRRDVVARLLEKHRVRIPHHHDSGLYAAAAARTKSAAGCTLMAFPDFWGHVPPHAAEPMVARQPNTQRKKVLEDVRRIVCPDELIDRTVFDLEDPRREYDLILNADANSCENHQWFYFEVSGMDSGACYRFNVINCEKPNSQFNYGMQPVLFSVRDALVDRPHWVRVGSDICYYRNHYCPRRGPNGSSYYTLTFSVIFKHSEDVCYLAYHYPYTYSALQTHLQILQESVDPQKIFYQQQSLCSTMGGNPCPVVTITACPASRSRTPLQQLHKRPYVVLTARVHPGESNASWMMKGSLEFLCSEDPVAEALREVYIFKILPMLNPDGVVNGFSRCGLSGEDLNRQWKKPDPVLSPTIFHAKGLLYFLGSVGRSPLVFCDYHGHSRKKNVFLYGCGVEETPRPPGSAIDGKEDPEDCTIAKALERLAPAFSLSGCRHAAEKWRESTARVVLRREMGVRRSYTMESTYNGCNQGIYKGMQLGTRELEEMGAHFCRSLLSLRSSAGLHGEELMHHASALLGLEDDPQDRTSHSSFEDDEPPGEETVDYHDDWYPEQSGEELDNEIDDVSSSEEEGEGVGEDEPQRDSLGVLGRAEH